MYWLCITQGLRPGLCRSIALKGFSTTPSKSMSVRRTRFCKYAHLHQCLRALTFVSTSYLFWYLRTPKFSTQLKSVQTSAVVCTNFSCSLYRLRRGFENRKCNSYFFLVYLGIFMKPLACLFMYRKAIDDGADYVPFPRIHLGLSARLSYTSKNN